MSAAPARGGIATLAALLALFAGAQQAEPTDVAQRGASGHPLSLVVRPGSSDPDASGASPSGARAAYQGPSSAAGDVLAAPPEDGDDHGDTRADATTLALGEIVGGRIHTHSDRDVFRLTVAEPGRVGVFVVYDFWMDGRLFDADGLEPDGLEWQSQAKAFLIRGELAAGVYYLELEGRGGHDDYEVGAMVDLPVDLPDVQLRAVVEQALYKSTGEDVYSGEMAAFVRELRAPSAGIRDLAGLEAALLLSRLWLPANGIESPLPLAGLFRLREIDLFGNALTDVSALGGLPQLTRLDLGDNRLADIGPLAGSSRLARLSLSGNALTDVSPLGELEALEHLDLGGNRVRDVSALLQLRRLRWLDLRNNPLSALALERQVPQLEDMGVLLVPLDDDHGNGRETATPMGLGGAVPGVIDPYHDRDYFRLEVDRAVDVDVFTTGDGPKTARLLDASGAELARDNVDGATNNILIRRRLAPGSYYVAVSVPTREQPYVLHAAVDNVEVHFPGAGVRWAVERALHKMAGEPITAAEMATLSVLAAVGLGDQDLTGLESAINLKVLRLVNGGLVDVAGLAGLTGLEVLDLRGNRITDLAPLAGLTNLRELYLDDNEVADVSALAGLEELTTLGLAGNALDDAATVATLPALKWVDLQRNPLGATAGDPSLVGLRNAGVVVLHPLDHGGAPETATDITLGEVRRGSLHIGGDVDYFRFETGAAVNAAVVVAEGGWLAVVRLLDEGGAEVARGEGETGVSPVVIEARLARGVYFVEVARKPNYSGSWDYTITALEVVDVEIPDPNLRRKVERYLGKDSSGPITSADMATLTEFRAILLGIADLTGLEYATGLGRLFLFKNAIRDLAPLAGLRHLRELHLSDNHISDLAALDGLKDLASLELSNNQVAEVAPLAGLAGLWTLGLSGNAIRDVTPLADLSRLQNLELADNRIADIAPLRRLTRLQTLDLGGNEIEDVSPVDGLRELTRLELRSNPLSDRSIGHYALALGKRGVAVTYEDDHGELRRRATRLLVGAPGYGTIEPYYDRDLFRFRVDREWDFVFFARNARVRLLDASGAELARVDKPGDGAERRLARGTYYLEATGIDPYHGNYTLGVGEVVPLPDDGLNEAVRRAVGARPGEDVDSFRMRRMKTLRVNNAGVRDLAGLEFAKELETLELAGNHIGDISSLAGMTALTSLDLSNNAVADISALAEMEGLTTLRLADNRIADLSVMERLSSLTWLDLSSNRIEDISPLANLRFLTRLELSNNRIADVAPLAALVELVVLKLSDNMVSDLAAVGNLICLEDLDLAGNRIGNIAPLAVLTELRRLSLERNAVEDVSALMNLTRLSEILTADNGIVDASPVAELPDLWLVDLRRNPLSDRSLEVHVPRLLARAVRVAVADRHGDRRETATRIEVGAVEPGLLDPYVDLDYFRLAVTSPVDMVLTSTGRTDTVARLLDPEGRELSRGQDNRVRNNFRIQHRLAPGLYNLEVALGGYRHAGRAAGAYTLLAWENEAVTIPDPEVRQALERGLRKPAGALMVADMLDLVLAWLPHAGVRELSGLEAAASLEIVIIDNNEIVDIGPLVGLPTLEFLDVRGNPLRRLSVDSHIRELRDRGVVVVEADDHGDDAGAATRLAPNGTSEGLIYPIAERDYFRIELGRAGELSVVTLGRSDTAGRMLNAAGDVLATADDGGSGRNFSITRELPPGIHYLEVTARPRGNELRLPRELHELTSYAPYVVQASFVAPPEPPLPPRVSAQIEGTTLVVVWNAFGSGDVSGYRVLVVGADGRETRTCTTSPGRRRCVFDGLRADGDYEVTVEAIGSSPAATGSATSELAPEARSMWRGWRLELLRRAARDRQGVEAADAK